MARRYCSVDDVRAYLPTNVVVEGDNPSPNFMNPNREAVMTVNVLFFIEQASDRVDMMLGTIYDVPLKKTNHDGEVKYPAAISYITAVLAAQMIYAQKLQGADKQKSESQIKREEDAIGQLSSIQNGEAILKGQRARGHRFISSTLYNAPYNPSQGGRSQGRGGR
jgi:hypothetical protein